MRIGRVVSGLVLLLVGGLLTATGIVGLTAFGSSGSLRVTSTALATEPDGYALVHDVLGVSAGFPYSESLGRTTIGARSDGGERLFIGLGATDDVNEYLAGVPYEAIHQDGSTWQSDAVPGPDEPAAPSEQDFWIRESTGNDPSVEFSGRSGAATLVVMNADGTPGVRAFITVGYVSGTIFPLSLAATAVGGILALLGLVLLLRSRRRPATADAAAAPVAAHADTAPAPAAPAAPPGGQRSAAPPPTGAPVPVGPESAATADPPADDAGEPLPDEWSRQSDGATAPASGPDPRTEPPYGSAAGETPR